MKKAIVTGANGFVGAAVCRELADLNVSIIAIVRKGFDDVHNISNIPGIKILYCDLSNYKNLSNIIKDNDVDILYHFAWEGSSGTLRGDLDVQIKNIQFTCDLVGACSEIGCKKFVFASSIMEYEINALMNEEIIPPANSLYSCAKLSADYFARVVCGTLGVEYIRALISNIYGPGEISARFVNTTLRKFLNREYCSFSSGEQMYDFIYITDAAKELVFIGDKGKTNKTYYIGSNNPRPLKDFIFEMRDCVDPEIEIGLGDLMFEGVSLEYNEFDIHSVTNDTGFVPEVSFEEGINNTIKWIKEHM